MTGRFPSLMEVGDLLALGVDIAPEQEELVSAPGGRPYLAVWALPDPMLESGQSFYVDGMVQCVPIVMQKCDPDEPNDSAPWLKRATLREMLMLDTDPFELPTVIGEEDAYVDMPYKAGDFEVTDEHYARQPWDLWPIDSDATTAFNNAVSMALNKSGYLPLIDYLSWSNGYNEPLDKEHEMFVEQLVLDSSGHLKTADEFPVDIKKHLPREYHYTWERLIDLSQQGQQAYGMSLSEEERKRFFHPLNGDSTWF